MNMAPFVSAIMVLYTFAQGSLCADLFFLTSKPVELPDPMTVFLSSKDVVNVNKYMLGLTAEAPSTWSSEGDVFNRPRALAILTVTDGKALKILPDAGYALSREAVDFDHGELIDSKLFGEEQEWLLLNSAGFSGSHIATEAQNANPRIEVKTKIEPLRQEIQNLYKLAESIGRSEVLRNANTPTIFIIDVKGLQVAEQQLSLENYGLAVNELEKAITNLASTLKSVYDDRVIVELIAESHSEIQKRVKRQSSTSEESYVTELRVKYNVYQFVSSDYPAIFAIFAGVSIILSLAVLFVAVGLWNMDPGKDSIIYRMTTTRMKKD